MSLYNEMLSRARAFFGEIREDYRALHKMPEVGMRLPRTLDYCMGRLLEMGYSPRVMAGGIVAMAGQGERCILLRADMDALPLLEESGVCFASENKNMHACGHDMHTAMLLGGARIIKELEERLPCSVKLCFQAGEETLSGARAMINEGLLEGPRVNAAAMIHVLTATGYPTGTLILPPAGVGATGVDFFKVTVEGKGCHGAMPGLGRDPISAQAQIISALSMVSARELDGGEGEVLTVGRISAGESANVIPEKAELWGTLRAKRDERREYMKKRLWEISENTAAALRCRARLEITGGAPSFVNDEALLQRAREAFCEASPRPCFLERSEGGGSEDFAYVSRQVPSLMVCLSAGSIGEGYGEPLHSQRVRFNEEALVYGAAAYASLGFM